MATIITVLSLLKDATKVTKKVFPNADLDTFINELDSALKSPAALKMRTESIREKINGVMDKLSPTEQQSLQNNVNQSFSSNGLNHPFDENGNLDVHFSDFLAQCEILDVAGTADLSESVCSVTDSISVATDAGDVADGADSIWDFLVDLF